MTSGIYPPDVGGPATYVERLTRTLAADGRDVRAVVLSDAVSRELGNATIRRISRAQPLPLRMGRTTATVASISRHGDTIYASGVFVESAVAALSRRSRLVIKVVGDYAWETAHNRGETDVDLLRFQDAPPASRRVAAVGALQRWWCRAADALIVNSQFLASIVRGWGVLESGLHVIPNAVEAAAVASPHQQMHSSTEIRALSGGRLLRWKGFELLLEVALMVPRLRLTLVGDGPLKSTLTREIRRLGLTDRVVLANPVEPGEMARHYGESDVFMLPSSSETFSYMTAEAMAAGLPVIVARAGALPEIVDDGRSGILCELTSPREWVNAVDHLAADRHFYAKTASEGLHRVRTKYSWDAIYRSTLPILDGVTPTVADRTGRSSQP